MPDPSSDKRPRNKSLIVCCDGTWQNSHGGNGETPTNVTRITRALKKYDKYGIAQVVYYQSGVGTGGPVDRIVGGSTGYGLAEHVREAYGFLAHNYCLGDTTKPADIIPDDTIHLIGFSRGAYTARSICGLISRIGILTKKGMDSFHRVYDGYKAKKYLEDPDWVRKILGENYDSLVIPDVKIETISCWDTVGSLGIPSLEVPIIKDLPKIKNFFSGVNHERYDFHDTELSPQVKHAFHALALDERRRHFEPALWKKTEETMKADLKQCWFPGVHSNIGGGVEDQEIADMTLAWMIQQLSPYLGFDDNYLDSIIVNNDGISKGQWATGGFYDDWKTWLLNWGGKARELGVDDNNGETMHRSVRVRRDFESEWSCKALKGWTWDEKGSNWTNGSKTIREDGLGSLEERLAGPAVQRDHLQAKKNL